MLVKITIIIIAVLSIFLTIKAYFKYPKTSRYKRIMFIYLTLAVTLDIAVIIYALCFYHMINK